LQRCNRLILIFAGLRFWRLLLGHGARPAGGTGLRRFYGRRSLLRFLTRGTSGRVRLLFGVKIRWLQGRRSGLAGGIGRRFFAAL
jgi:hypothetical protein